MVPPPVRPHAPRPDEETAGEGDGAARYLLHFGAVDYAATVWLNGRRVGEHEGGYLPFEFDVTGLLEEGANEPECCRLRA
ncbi:MAG: hypothetical protein H0X69_05480 [Gemmatimonadales bacterium]|nr:hypothetical protein [Gemmatimonadales bacterium]